MNMKPIPKRTRASLPNTQAGIEDISVLNLAEVRSRLERNERVLSTSLFSSSPTSSTLASFGTSPNSPLARGNQTSPPPDPFRDKLLAARQALLAREQELLMEAGMVKMEVGEPVAESSTDARRRSEGMVQNENANGNTRSGKARAMEAIQAGEVSLSPSGKILPYAQTLALGERDFDNATAQTFGSMSMNSHAPPTKPKYDPNDEIARAQANARMKAFLSYKGDPEEGEGAGEGDDDQLFEDDWMEGEYDGDNDKFALGPQGRETRRTEPGTGEEVDEQGEDDEEWAEGADEYLDRVR